jgi:hypothetical protein
MYQLLAKRGQSFAFLLGIVITLIFLLSVLGGVDEFNLLSRDQQKLTNIFNFGLKAALVLVVVTALAWILFGLFHLVTNIKGSLKSLIPFLLLLAVFFIAYSMADPGFGSAITGTLEKFSITEGISKIISGALTTSLILVVLGVVGAVLFEVINMFK